MESPGSGSAGEEDGDLKDRMKYGSEGGLGHGAGVDHTLERLSRSLVALEAEETSTEETKRLKRQIIERYSFSFSLSVCFFSLFALN